MESLFNVQNGKLFFKKVHTLGTVLNNYVFITWRSMIQFPVPVAFCFYLFILLETKSEMCSVN